MFNSTYVHSHEGTTSFECTLLIESSPFVRAAWQSKISLLKESFLTLCKKVDPSQLRSILNCLSKTIGRGAFKRTTYLVLVHIDELNDVRMTLARFQQLDFSRGVDTPADDFHCILHFSHFVDALPNKTQNHSEIGLRQHNEWVMSWNENLNRVTKNWVSWYRHPIEFRKKRKMTKV